LGAHASWSKVGTLLEHTSSFLWTSCIFWCFRIPDISCVTSFHPQRGRNSLQGSL